MKPLFPYPLLWALLLVLWLMLNESLATGEVVLGAVLSMAACIGFARLQPPGTSRKTRPLRRRFLAVMRLGWHVMAEVLRSNLAVALIVLRSGRRGTTSAFLDIPLQVRDAGALAALACIITATPGTAWARYDAASGILTMHILDLIDERAMIHIIKDIYEGPLMEIFE